MSAWLRLLKPRNLRTVAQAPRFSWLKYRADGMLSPLAYREIYRRVRRLPDLPFVEIGAGSGSSTVAIAWAYRDNGHDSPVLTVEKCQGGSRDRFGSFDDNLKILSDNLARFGVADRVILHTETISLDTGEVLQNLVGGRQLAGFMHDADGRLDRDFILFWPTTLAGGLIIVDDFTDYDDIAALYREFGISAKKKLMACRAVRLMTEHGLFARDDLVGDTLFGHKPHIEGKPELPAAQLTAVVEQARVEYEAYVNAMSARTS